MKQTTNVFLGGRAFTIEQDAFERLDGYLRDIRSRITDPSGDTIADIEARISDLLDQALSSSIMVVTIDMVDKIIARIGDPSTFGPAVAVRSESRDLRRSTSDGVIAGVCSGFAHYFGLDPLLMRVVAILLVLFCGVSVWAYIILWLVIPEQDSQK